MTWNRLCLPRWLLGAAAIPTTAAAQVKPTTVSPISGTRLDVSATGEVTRVPDVAVISAGVVTRAAVGARRA